MANLTLLAAPAARAIYTQTGLADMGAITLENLSVTGQVSIITRGGTNRLKLVVDRLHISACDSRATASSHRSTASMSTKAP